LVIRRRKKPIKSSRAHIHSSAKHPKDILSEAYKQLKAGKPVVAGHVEHIEHERGPLVSVREVEYKGHKIVIRTAYEIKVNGKALSGHLFVDNSGRVYSHAMPTYSFPSAVDLVKNLIDTFPASFSKGSKRVLRRKKGGQ